MVDVRLEVNGRQYGGWKTVEITRGIEAIANSFKLTVSERWDGQSQPWPIAEEDACTIRLNNRVLLTGFVDSRSHKVDAESHTLTIAGRDAAGALVDCSAELTNWEFNHVPVLELCKQLGSPFGIVFSLQDGLVDTAIGTAPSATSKARAGGAPSSVGSAGKSSSLSVGKPNAKLTVTPGDSPFEVIDRACRLVGVLPVSDGLGGIVLTRAGGLRATTNLTRGVNILDVDASFDATKRHRRYVVTGQSQGTDDIFGPSAAAVKSEATDQNVRRSTRVLLVRPEGSVTLAFAKQRAAWEATVRAARAADVVIAVQGWTQNDGSLWPTNALVFVNDPVVGIQGLMLITEATFSLSDEGGSTTRLKVVRPDAFIPEPVITSTGAGADSAFRQLLG